MDPQSDSRQRVDRGAHRLRIATACGAALLASVALVSLARELALTRGPLVAALIVALLLAAALMFARALLEPRPAVSSGLDDVGGAIGLLSPQEGLPLMPMAYFPLARQPEALAPLRHAAPRSMRARSTHTRSSHALRSARTSLTGCATARRLSHPRRTLRLR